METGVLSWMRSMGRRLGAIALLAMLVRTRWALRATLGGTLDTVHTHITRLGLGDFSTPITVQPGMEASVLGRLAQARAKLDSMDSEPGRRRPNAWSLCANPRR